MSAGLISCLEALGGGLAPAPLARSKNTVLGGGGAVPLLAVS